jgi:hypothetical protein
MRARWSCLSKKHKNERANGAILTASGLPKMLSDIRNVVVNFGFNDKLFRITATSAVFENDPRGVIVQQRYDELLTVLESRYGKVASHHENDGTYSSPNEFVMSLRTGRAFHYTEFRTAEVAVQLAIRAKDTSGTDYALLYEFVPLLKQYQADKRAKEKDTL